MTDEELLQKHLSDLADRSFSNSIYTFSKFLSINEADLFYKMKGQLSFAEPEAFGGVDGAERIMVRFGSEEAFGYAQDYPIDCIKISPLAEKFGQLLTHRDYLGALMNLGIERDLLGDIMIREKTAYVFCSEHISPYICESLDKVSHTNVKCEVCTEIPDDIRPKFETKQVIVSSNRLDGVISKLYNLSRGQSQNLFSAGKIFINGRQSENTSYAGKPGDIISVRGFGKFIFEGNAGSTQKGREKINLNIYV